MTGCTVRGLNYCDWLHCQRAELLWLVKLSGGLMTVVGYTVRGLDDSGWLHSEAFLRGIGPTMYCLKQNGSVNQS